MKNARKLLRSLVVIAMAFTMVLPAFAVYKQSIYIPANQSWTAAGTDSRTGAFSYVEARCHSVYPSSGEDKFEIIQCKVTNSGGTQISDKVYSLDETDSTNTVIDLKEGYLQTTTVKFWFRGNTSSAASAVVSYYGK